MKDLRIKKLILNTIFPIAIGVFLSWGIVYAGNNAKEVASITKNNVIEVRVEFPNPIITEVDGYYHIEMEGVPSLGNTGEPVLPVKGINVLIPAGKNIKSSEVILGEEVTLPGIYNIEPAQRPVPLSYEGPVEKTLPKKEIYNSNNPYPKEKKEKITDQKMHGYEIAVFKLCPIEYIPKEGKLSYYKSITVKLNLETKPKVKAKEIIEGKKEPKLRKLPKDKKRLEQFISNPQDISSYDIPAKSGEVETGNGAVVGVGEITLFDPADSYQYIIVTNENLKNAPGPYNFQALCAEKEARGITTNIVTTEWIYANYDGTRPDGGTDNATKIRNFIIDAHNNWETEYILLGGDGDGADVGGESGDNIIPARKFFDQVVDDDASDLIPSDLYYACLDGTFDSNANGIYGEINDGDDKGYGTNNEIDLLAEVYVGRAPVDSTDEVSNFVRKTLSYEASTSPYLREAYMVGEYLGFGGASQYATASMEEIRLGSEYGAGFIDSGYFNTSCLYDSDGYNWPKSDIINIIDNGVHVLNHLGHGSPSHVMKLDNDNNTDKDADNLINDEYCFIYSQACYPASFDNWKYPPTSAYLPYDSIAEHLVCGEHGAFAYIGNSRYGWGEGYSTNGSSQFYNRKFWDAVFGLGLYSLGEANEYSKESNIPFISYSMNRWCYFEINLLGDPETRLHISSSDKRVRIIEPERMTIIHDEISFSGTVKGEGLISYTLEYGAGRNPSVWSDIFIGISPVENGTIATFDTSQLPDGIYTFKLQAIYSDGTVLEDNSPLVNVKIPTIVTVLKDGLGVGDVTVNAYVPSGPTFTSTKTNSEGKATLYILEGTQVYFKVIYQGSIIAIGGTHIDIYTVPADVTVNIPAPSTVTVLKDGVGGAGIWVFSFSESYHGAQIGASQTDSEGKAIFYIPEGMQVFFKVWYQDALLLTDIYNAPVNVTVNLPSPTTVTVLKDGVGERGLWVCAYRGEWGLDCSMTNSEGKATFYILEGTQVNFYVDYLYSIIPTNTYTAPADVTVNIPPPSTVTVLKDGVGEGGIVVDAYSGRACLGSPQTRYDGGKATFYILEGTQVYFKVRYQGSIITYTDTYTAPADVTVNIPPPTTVTVLKDGVGEEGIAVRALSGGAWVVGYSQTNSEGKATFYISEGTQVYFYVDYLYSIILTNTYTAPADVTVNIPPPSTVTVLKDGVGERGLWVYAYRGEWRLDCSMTNSEGKVTFYILEGTQVYFKIYCENSVITTANYSAPVDITVDLTPALIADFTASPVIGEAPLKVNFKDASTGIITSWLWDFGDGETSTEKNPTHTYNYVGTYTVSLTVTGPGGEDTCKKRDYINVTYYGKIYDAYSDKKVILPGEVVNLYAKVTTNAFNSYGWLCDGKEFISGVVPGIRFPGTVNISNSIDISAYSSYFTPGQHEIQLRASKIINGVISVDIYSEPFTITVAKDGKLIQDDIDNASPGDTILVEPGVYKLTSNLNITKSITLKAIDPDPDNTIFILGDYYINAKCLLPLPGHPLRYLPKIAIEGVTITGYTGKDKNGPIQNYHTNLTLKSCKIIDNKGIKASAIYNSWYSILNLKNTLIAKNTNIPSNDMYQYGYSQYREYLFGKVYCGTIYLDGASNLTVYNSTIADNINASQAITIPGSQTGYGETGYGQTGYGEREINIIYGAIQRSLSDKVEMTSSIMWKNGKDNNYLDFSYILPLGQRRHIINSDIQNLGIVTRYDYLQDVIKEDPLFEPEDNDYYPQNQNCLDKNMGARFE